MIHKDHIRPFMGNTLHFRQMVPDIHKTDVFERILAGRALSYIQLDIHLLAIAADITNFLIPLEFDRVNHIAHLAGYLSVIPFIFLVKQGIKKTMIRNFFLSMLLVFILGLFYYFKLM